MKSIKEFLGQTRTRSSMKFVYACELHGRGEISGLCSELVLNKPHVLIFAQLSLKDTRRQVAIIARETFRRNIPKSSRVTGTLL